MSQESKKILLHGWHREHAVRMEDFGGYDMPLWYETGPKKEHLAVLTDAGLFDTSHMALLTIKGENGLDLIQKTFSKDLALCIGPKKLPLGPGRCAYGVFADEHGHVIDDSLVYNVAEQDYMLVVNAGMGPVIAGHLVSQAAALGLSGVEITDYTDRLSKFDVQGPASLKIMRSVLADPDAVFDFMPYFSFKGHFDPASEHSKAVQLKDGTPILLSRTGYTGEFGFEIFLSPEFGHKVWDLLMEAGKEFNLCVCGLAARDSLRMGAVLPLSHQDIGHWVFKNNPWPFALPYGDDGGFTKSFLGDAAISQAPDDEFTYPFVGKDVRKVVAGEGSQAFDGEGGEIGIVLTCATDMGIGFVDGTIYSIASADKPEGFSPRGLACGFVKVSKKLAPGDVITVKDARRSLPVTIVEDIRPARTARRKLDAML